MDERVNREMRFQIITGLYRAMEQGAALAIIADRHANDPITMADEVRAALSTQEPAAPVVFAPVVEAETERVAA